jgi:cobaltochelatase CobS
MTFKRRAAKPSAADVLGDLKKATTKKDHITPTDELVAHISSTILKSDAVKAILAELSSDTSGSWSLERFRELTGADAAAELIYNSAFVRAAARTGVVFYLGPDKTVYRHRIRVGSGRVSASTASPAPPPTSEADKEFYLKPTWYGDLQQFVEEGVPILLIGPPGSGKSEACEQVFAERKQPLHIISCNPSMTADDLEGRVELRNEGGVVVTRFEKGELAVASAEGRGVLLDEADAVPPHAAFGIFRLLAGKDMRILRMGDDGRVPRHNEFRIVGTQNTEGRGDDRGLHHGRVYQDEAFLDRWENVIRVQYFPKDMEAEILIHRTGVSVEDASKIVDGAELLRRALHENAIMFCCSMRRTLAVARNLVRGYNPMHAWDYAVVNRATREDVGNITDILGRVYEGFDKKNGRRGRQRRK